MTIIGVIPAAGYAARMQPLQGSKETYSIGGRPVIDYLVERMRAARCDQLRIVTRPEKRDVVEYAEAQGAEVVEASPPSLGKSIALGLIGLSRDDVVLLGFPDSIWEPLDGYRRLVRTVEDGFDVVLGLFRTQTPETCDVVVLGESGFVRDLELKSPTPSSDVFWGAAAARAGALEDLSRSDDPGILFKRLARTSAIPGVWLSERYVDIGTKAGLEEALRIAPSLDR
jgi:glucose-1-phosphate thymidylyltransferase